MADYYDANAQSYFEATVGLNLDSLYRPFLTLVPAGGRILDAGCGSGRDAKHFHKLGFQVVAIDASKELVKLAREHTGLPVERLPFQRMHYRQEFDAIWACASLLHVPSSEMISILSKFRNALKTGGTLYVSFRHGNAEGMVKGNYLTCYTKQSFHEILFDLAGLELHRMWITPDLRPERADVEWLNILLRAE